MIAHTGINVRNYPKAKKFYQKTLAPLGYKLTMDHPEWRAGGFKQGGMTDFWIGERGKFVKGHIAFLAKNKKRVQAFHAAALTAGGKDSGKPGFRTQYSSDYYAAFALDPDSNNVEACYFGEKAAKSKMRR